MEQRTYAETQAVPKETLSFEEFLQRYDETHAEWVNGKAIPKMPVSVIHQRLSRFLYTLLSVWAEYHQIGEVHPPPLLVKLPLPEGKEVAREPDIVVILNSNSGRFAENYFDGAPDVIVEIVSPASRHTDRFVKYEEYEAAGVTEYWLIDPERRYAEFFQRDEVGLYRTAFSGSEGVYRSRVLEGFWLEVSWLWQPPLLREVLQRVELV